MKRLFALLLALTLLCAAAVAEGGMLAGGWAAHDIGEAIPEEALTAFENALSQYAEEWDIELAYKPEALLSTQVVAGLNYLFLCSEEPEDALNTDWAFVTVYADLQGGATITNISSAGLNDSFDDFDDDYDYETEMSDDFTVVTVRVNCDESIGIDWNIAILDETLFELITCEYAAFEKPDVNGVTGQYVASFKAVEGIEFGTTTAPFRVEITTATLMEDGEPLASFVMDGDIHKDGSLDVMSTSFSKYVEEE